MDSKSVLVVGGGPAGAVVAGELAQADFKVTLIETHQSFRTKIGECLPPNIKPLLTKLSLVHLLDKHKISYANQSAWGASSVTEDDFILGVHGAGTHIDRPLFEHDLMQAAIMNGANYHPGTKFKSCVRENNRWTVTLESNFRQREIIVDYIVDASGRRAVVAKALGVQRESMDKLVGISMVFHDQHEPNSATLVEATEYGWWYSATLPNNKLIVTLMTDSHLISRLRCNKQVGFLSLLSQTHQTLARLEHKDNFEGQEHSAISVHKAGSSWLTELCGDGWLAVGDAAYSYDPLSSYGITSAMGTAYYASRAIIDHFQGRSDTFLCYCYLLDKMYANYLQQLQSAYMQEQRWPHSDFWCVRQQPH